MDAYDVCRHVRRYIQKNGYAPTLGMLDCTTEEAAQLVTNGVLEGFSLYEGGPITAYRLTDKGLRMAEAPRKRR
jgi:hypothetical protein